MDFPEQCVNLEQIGSGMRDFCFEVAWRKSSVSLLHRATVTLLLQGALLGEGVPQADLRNGCCLLGQTQCWPCSPPPVPEEGLYPILCNSY